MIDLTEEELDDWLWQMSEDSSKIAEYLTSENIAPNTKENDG